MNVKAGPSQKVKLLCAGQTVNTVHSLALTCVEQAINRIVG